MELYNILISLALILASIVSCFFAFQFGKRHNISSDGPLFFLCGAGVIASMLVGGLFCAAAIDTFGIIAGPFAVIAQLPLFGMIWLLINCGDSFLTVTLSTKFFRGDA